MFSHIMIGSNDMARSKKFYDALFAAMGAGLGVEDARGRLAYSHNGGRFMVSKPIDGKPASVLNGGTIGFQMKDAAQAEAWHKAGVANGGTSIEDRPGVARHPQHQSNRHSIVALPLVQEEWTCWDDPVTTRSAISCCRALVRRRCSWAMAGYGGRSTVQGRSSKREWAMPATRTYGMDQDFYSWLPIVSRPPPLAGQRPHRACGHCQP